MNYDVLQSKTIDYLRFPLAVLVVFIHTSQTNVALPSINFANLSGTDVHDILTIVFSRTIATIAVPLFFVMSGYLFFFNVKEWGKHEYLRKLKSRIRTLFIPYLIWNAIVLALSVGRALYIYHSSGEVNHILEQLSTVSGWLKPFWNQSQYGPVSNILGQQFYVTFPYNGPFWFIRDLIGMCLVSPLIYLVARYGKVWALAVLGLALYSFVWIHIPGFGIEAFTYFTLGAYFSIHKKNLVEQSRRVKTLFGIISVIAFALTLYGLPDIGRFSLSRAANLLFIVTGGVSVINLTAVLLDKGKIYVSTLLSKSSFMIFAAHGLLLTAIKPLFDYVFRSDSIISNILYYFLLPLSTCVVCVVAYYILTRYFPRLATILVGSRGGK